MTAKIWLAINKDEQLVFFCDKPKRDSSIGKWKANNIYVNSIIYTDIKKMVDKSKFNWNSEPEFLQLNLK